MTRRGHHRPRYTWLVEGLRGVAWVAAVALALSATTFVLGVVLIWLA